MLDKILDKLFSFYDPKEKIGFYRSFEYWFDNIPFIERNFLNLVSFWFFLIILIFISPLLGIIYFQLCYLF